MGCTLALVRPRRIHPAGLIGRSGTRSVAPVGLGRPMGCALALVRRGGFNPPPLIGAADLDTRLVEAGLGLFSMIVLVTFDTRHLLFVAFEVRVGGGLEATARGEAA